MERNLLMSKDKKGRRWDGRSRISTPKYKKNYDDIFKKEQNQLNESYKQSIRNKKERQANMQSDNIDLKKLTTTTHEIQTEIVNGRCPTCTAETVLVSIWPHLFRCMTCGTDLEQKVNGKISYIPNTKNIELRMKVDGQS
jgi:ribosomal protein S27E